MTTLSQLKGNSRVVQPSIEDSYNVMRDDEIGLEEVVEGGLITFFSSQKSRNRGKVYKQKVVVMSSPLTENADVQVCCDCESYYFTSMFANVKGGCHCGDASEFMAMQREKPVRNSTRVYKPRNPKLLPCLCKHLYLTVSRVEERVLDRVVRVDLGKDVVE